MMTAPKIPSAINRPASVRETPPLSRVISSPIPAPEAIGSKASSLARKSVIPAWLLQTSAYSARRILARGVKSPGGGTPDCTRRGLHGGVGVRRLVAKRPRVLRWLAGVGTQTAQAALYAWISPPRRSRWRRAARARVLLPVESPPFGGASSRARCGGVPALSLRCFNRGSGLPRCPRFGLLCVPAVAMVFAAAIWLTVLEEGSCRFARAYDPSRGKGWLGLARDAKKFVESRWRTTR